MVRLTTKNTFFIVLGCMGLVVLIFHQRCTIQHQLNLAKVEEKVVDNIPVIPSTPPMDNITCIVNKEVAKNIGWKKTPGTRFQCRTDGREIFVPFSWVRSTYEPKGEMTGPEEFEISQSYSKVFTPKGKYRPDGPFMNFNSMSVESRSRVKCVSASDGVPVSTQWSPDGYYYPTQIAQFSLSHYSIHITNPELVERDVVEVKDVKLVADEGSGIKVVEFIDKLDIPITSPNLVLTFDFKSLSNASFTIVLDTGSEDVRLHYRPVKEFIKVVDDGVVFGLGEDKSGVWIKLTRDLFVDLDKAILAGLRGLGDKKSRKKSKRKSHMKILRVEFRGHGRLTNITVSNNEHLRLFHHGADWFLNNQDTIGGWPSLVVFNKDRKKYPKAEEVGTGWYGAMCQGQAISVLVRAFLSSGEEKYLDAARRALGPFEISSSEGGVVAKVMDRWVWFEEYPTQPPSHILNGFMYALIGLYDLSQIEGETKAEELYQTGMDSLRVMLPLFDSGSGTFYDLRHFTMKTAPKGARWDYHSTHINQLYTLYTVDKGEILKETAERWRGYMMGIKSSHN